MLRAIGCIIFLLGLASCIIDKNSPAFLEFQPNQEIRQADDAAWSAGYSMFFLDNERPFYMRFHFGGDNSDERISSDPGPMYGEVSSALEPFLQFSVGRAAYLFPYDDDGYNPFVYAGIGWAAVNEVTTYDLTGSSAEEVVREELNEKGYLDMGVGALSGKLGFLIGYQTATDAFLFGVTFNW